MLNPEHSVFHVELFLSYSVFVQTSWNFSNVMPISSGEGVLARAIEWQVIEKTKIFKLSRPFYILVALLAAESISGRKNKQSSMLIGQVRCRLV